MNELKDKLKIYFDKFENLVDEAISECIEEDKIIEFGYEFSFSQNRYSWPVNGVLHDGKLCWCSVLTDEKIYIEPMNFKDKLLFLTQLNDGVELKYSDVHNKENKVFGDDVIRQLNALKELGFKKVTDIMKIENELHLRFEKSEDEYFMLIIEPKYNILKYFNEYIETKYKEVKKKLFNEKCFRLYEFEVYTEELINAKQKHIFMYIKDIYSKEENTKK